MHPLLNIAISAARSAGEIITRNMANLDRINPTLKNNEGYVSDVDIKAEQAIIHAIHKAYPEHGIIAEESGYLNEDAETVWIIDPLDGTTNYLHGFPFFSVSIAIRVKGRIEHGVILDPVRHECFSASHGGGARLNDQRIRVSKRKQLNTALLGTGFPFRDKVLTQRYLPTLESVSEHCHAIRRTGSAALDLAYVACGRLDGYWEFGLKPWDIAAGTLIIQEAGGLVTDLQANNDFVNKGDIITATPKMFKALFQAINSAL